MGFSLASPRNWWLSCWLLIFVASAVSGRDCNGNGVEDADDISDAFSEDCDDNGIPDECEGIPFQMAATAASIGVARSVRLVRTGDLDGDGDADLVVGTRRSRTESKVFVLLNQGAGEFASPMEFAAGGNLYSLVLDDLDGDGHLDVVSANQDHILVLLNNGDGSLAEPIVHAVSNGTRVLVTADVNGDGAPDVLTGNRDETTISVFLNAGDGSLEEPSVFTTGDDPTGIVAVDLDLDGDVDIATSNRDSDDASVLLNDGSGTFGDPVHYPLGNRPGILRSVDLTGDGFPDLVARTSTRVVVLLNTGDGRFTDAVSYSSSGSGLTVGDFDGDGDLDVASGARNIIQVNLNDGAGNLGVTTTFASPNSVTFVESGDLDGDGRVDLAVASRTGNLVDVLFNGRGASLSLSTELISPLVGCQDAGRGCRPHSGTAADMDGDGDIDVIGCNTHPGSFAILLNDGRGGMEIQRAYRFGAEHPQSVATSDLDGDGDLDAATVDNRTNELWVHLNKGDATFERPRRYRIGNAPLNIQLGDLDGDGDDDMVSSNEGGGSVTVLFNQGDATFDRQGVRDIRTGGSSPRAATLGDWDGDGDVDIAVANSGSASLAVLLNSGGGDDFERELYRVTGSPNHITSGDVNGDGHLDLITAQSTSRCAVLLNTGDGTGTFGDPIESPIGRLAYSLNVVDIDGDGLLDVATANETTSSVSLLLGSGDGTFQGPTHVDVGAGTGLRFVFPADFDADGDTDLVTTNREGRSFTMIFNQSALDAPDYASRICTQKAFYELSLIADDSSGAERFVKYTLPASANAALTEIAFQNTERYRLHEDFLKQVFPEQFPALDTFTYNNLIVRAGRHYFVGTIAQLSTTDGLSYGFSVFADFGDPVETLSAEEVKGVYDKLREQFRLDPFVYFPNTRDAVDVAKAWENPGFPIHFPSGAVGGDYVPYTIAVGYGRVRILSADEFDAVNARGQISFQDVLVLEEAPRDIEGVVGGVITAEPQGLLSHVAIRTNRRGTPNAFLRTALDDFREFDGKLVRLEVKEAAYSVDEVSESQAEEFWRNNRPRLSVPPSLDREFSELSSLAEIAALEAAGGDLPNESRFGGKASGLARLQTILDGPTWSKYQLAGFSIPAHYYLQFIASNRMPSALDAAREVTYEEYLKELFANGEFQSNSAFRFAALANLRDHMRNESQVDPELVEKLTARIREVYAHLPDDHRVRFRSSSNVEDAIEFNGAGLYDSLSVCASDDLDANDAGPSICDPDRAGERGIARGLRRVWASLWNFRAYEERAFYGIDQEIVAMGILSNKSFIDEQVNGVAFTGNPTNPADRRYVITAQVGEESVVSPEPGVRAEQNILEMGEAGQVTRILRAQASTRVPAGTFVLSDEQLKELGALMAHIDTNYPVDTGDHAREDVLLDLEFKIESSGALAVKQIRPFLLTNPEPEAPTFLLEIPVGTVACGLFNLGRTVREEYELKSELRFTPGSFELPTGAELFTTPIVEEITVGPGREVATAVGPGLFRVIRDLGGDGVINYVIEYEQDFTLSGEVTAKLRISIASTDERAAYFQTRDGVPVESRLVLDSYGLTDILQAGLEVTGPDGVQDIAYTSCGHEHLPLWHLTTEFEDGTTLRLEERLRPDLTRSVGPASLQAAEVVIGGSARTVTDYWELVYSATRHNTHEVYWVILDPPAMIPSVEKPIHAIELRARIFADNISEEAYYLGENFEILSRVETVSYDKVQADEAPKPFRRGDANADGEVNLTDAVSLLQYLFLEGTAPPCQKAADSLDDGEVNLSDAVAILSVLFGGRATLADPFNACGDDPTRDELECVAYPPCE